MIADTKERNGRDSHEELRQGSAADGFSQLGDSQELAHNISIGGSGIDDIPSPTTELTRESNLN